MQKITYTERVLILFNEDGSIFSAQQENVERVYDEDGQLYAEKRLGSSEMEKTTAIEILNKLTEGK